MRQFFFAIAVLFAFAVAHLVPPAATTTNLVLSAADEQTRTGKHRNVSTKLFEDLEELARLVDISYCVGTTGIYRPFRCLSHCSEFHGFELVTVSKQREHTFSDRRYFFFFRKAS